MDFLVQYQVNLFHFLILVRCFVCNTKQMSLSPAGRRNNSLFAVSSTFAEWLDLEGNSITGLIPDEILALDNLGK